MTTIAMALTGRDALSAAKERADLTGSPVCIWETAYAYHLSDDPPDNEEDEPLPGWTVYAVVEPSVYDLGEVTR